MWRSNEEDEEEIREDEEESAGGGAPGKFEGRGGASTWRRILPVLSKVEDGRRIPRSPSSLSEAWFTRRVRWFVLASSPSRSASRSSPRLEEQKEESEDEEDEESEESEERLELRLRLRRLVDFLTFL